MSMISIILIMRKSVADLEGVQQVRPAPPPPKIFSTAFLFCFCFYPILYQNAFKNRALVTRKSIKTPKASMALKGVV